MALCPALSPSLHPHLAMRQTLRRGQRLTRTRDFRGTMDRGRICRGKHFVLFCHVTGVAERPRVGFFASRRLGGAVDRNRAKRRLRAAYRRLWGRIEVEGVRLVFQARREAGKSPFSEVVAEMEQTFQRLGIVGPGREGPRRETRT